MRVDFASCELRVDICELRVPICEFKNASCEFLIFASFLNTKVERIDFDQIITSYKQFLLGKYNA